jgi:hypothetical protein
MVRQSRRATVAGCLVLTLGLVGCSSSDELVPARCLPGELPAAAARPAAAADALAVYLDVSQSVTNFGRGGGESAYRDLIAWLVGLRSEFPEARSYGFAERIAEIDEDVFVRAARGQADPCGAACGFRESRLDDVLAAIAAPESQGSLAVVVTDLWLDNSELIGRARLALQGPIRTILGDGRAIGVLGVAAPYSSQVYDVPVPAGDSTIPAGRVRQRPVFALVIGPQEQVAALERRIAVEVFMNAGEAERHFSLFTPTLAAAGPVEHQMAPQGPGVRRAYVLAVDGANVPGFLIDRRVVDPLIGDAVADGPALAASIAGLGHAGAPSPVTYDLAADTWTLLPPEPSAACDDGAWQPLGVGPALQAVTDSGGPAIGLDVSHPDLLAIRAGEIVFMRYRVAVGSLQQGGPATAWLDDWSFDAEDAQALRSDPPPLFPALNLSEFGRILEIAMDGQVAGETVAHGSVLLSTE